MAVIYLRHPIHGAKVASLDLEAHNDEMNGWERYEPSEPVVEPEPELPALVVNELAFEAPVARRGRRKQLNEGA